MKRTIAVLGALACLAIVTPACRHTEIHERPVVAQPAPQPAPTTVIEHDRKPDVIIEHH